MWIFEGPNELAAETFEIRHYSERRFDGLRAGAQISRPHGERERKFGARRTRVTSHDVRFPSVAEECVDVTFEVPFVDVDADVGVKFGQIVYREDAYVEGMPDRRPLDGSRHALRPAEELD